MLQQRKLLYALLNVAFITYVVTCAAVDSGGNVRSFYLFLLFALCSVPLLIEKPLGGAYAILTIFLAVYFVFYGVGDVPMPWSDRKEVLARLSTGVLSTAEIVILTGGGVLVLAYHTAVTVVSRSRTRVISKDWSPGVVVLVGLAFWAVGTYAAWVWSVDLITDTSNATARRALAGVSSVGTTMLLLGQLAKPLGIVILAYAQTVYRKPYLLPLLLAVVGMQVVFGFIVDIKGEAMLGGVLVIATKTLVQGKLPKAWLAVGLLFVVFAFPVFQAHRVVAGSRGANHTQVAESLGKMLQLALAAKDKVSQGRNRSLTFFERASLKPSVEMIVTGTAKGVPFQHGATLTPIVAALIPKIIWPTKPAVATGQVLNREFHVSTSLDTYISPSHLGELYWNFGWAGVLVGMTIIGLVLGGVGALSSLTQAVSITRLLLAVITIRQCIQGFEGVLSVAYVVWLRSVLGIALLHLVLARVPALAPRAASQRGARHSQDESAAEHTRTVPSP